MPQGKSPNSTPLCQNYELYQEDNILCINSIISHCQEWGPVLSRVESSMLQAYTYAISTVTQECDFFSIQAYTYAICTMKADPNDMS